MLLTQTINKANSFGREFVQTLRLAMDEKGKTASGKTKKALRYDVKIHMTGLEINFYAPDYWKYIGSGRGPGTPPPVHKIREWLQAKGGTQNLNEYAVAKRIGRDGSRDYRLKRPNIFTQEIKGVQGKLADTFVKGLKQDVTTETLKDFRRLKV